MAVSMRLPRLPWRILRASRALTVVPARARCSTAVSRSAITARADRYSGQQQPHGHQQQEIVLSRHRILEEVPYETHKVVGVTFEDRQPRVAKLHKGQPVVFVREPNNPFDPNAVAVQTLDGQHLGYMPRDINHRFLLDTCFGYVYSVGQTEQGLWGFQTAVQPSVAPVQVFAFPSTLVPHANLVPQLSGPAWEAMKSIILKAAGNRCKITGATGVEMHEEWVFDDGAQVLRLAGFQPISSEVHQVQHMLQLQSGSPQQQEAQRLLASLNQWRDADAHIYVQHMQQVQRQRSQQPNWKLDLGLLSSLQIQPPASIPRSLIVS